MSPIKVVLKAIKNISQLKVYYGNTYKQDFAILKQLDNKKEKVIEPFEPILENIEKQFYNNR
jgi:NAD(P)H-flavin reductase